MTPWSLSGSSAHGTLQARILEWLPFPSPGDLPHPGIEPGSPALQVDSLPSEPHSEHKPKALKAVQCKERKSNSHPAPQGHHLVFVFWFFFFFLAMLHRIWESSFQPGIEPMPLAVKAWSLNHWTARKVLRPPFVSAYFSSQTLSATTHTHIYACRDAF